MKRRSVPALGSGGANSQAVLDALRENVQLLTGERGGQIEALRTDATLAEVIAKTNEIIDRLMNR